MEIRRISPIGGVEVTGIDVAQPIGDNVFRELYQAWLDADGIMVIRDQRLTPEQHIEFSRRFGPLAKYESAVVAKYLLPGYPEIYRVSNKVVDGVPQGREDAGTYWHSDGSWDKTPLSAALLYALEIPPIGGDTIFANMYRAYETLSEPMKKMLEGLKAEHSLANAAKTSYGKEFGDKAAQVSQQRAIHPVVRTHPETGRKALFVNEGFTSRIIDLTSAESDAILGFLFRHSTRPELLYRHCWQLHDLVIWDNRTTLHYAVSDYKDIGTRYMHRTSVIGEVPC